MRCDVKSQQHPRSMSPARSVTARARGTGSSMRRRLGSLARACDGSDTEDERRPDGPATAARETGRHIRRVTAQPTCHPRVRLQCTPTYPHAHIHTVCTTNQSTRATNHRHNDKSQHAPHLSVASVACFRTSSARAHDSQHRYGHQIHHIEHAARPPYPFPSRREQLAALRCPCVGGVASSSIAA